MSNYESEAKLENRMIEQLRKQGYSYIEINDVKELEENFRSQVNLHNKVELKGKDLSDEEIVQAMIQFTIIIERPIVVFENTAIVARPAEKLNEFI